MTKQEEQDLEDWIVREIEAGLAEHANDPDADEDAVLPEYVPLPVEADEHLAILVPSKQPVARGVRRPD